jgi:hypothetical protein
MYKTTIFFAVGMAIGFLFVLIYNTHNKNSPE